MNSMELRVCTLWKRSLCDNDERSDIHEQEVMKPENVETGMSALVTSIGFMGSEVAINFGKPTRRFIKWDGHTCSWEEHSSESNTQCPSKFLLMCLNSVQNALQQSDSFSTEGDRPFFASPWGFEFWSSYTKGQDVLETNVGESTIEKIAWITSTAADTISMKEKDGLSFNGPFLLYLVPSQDKAHKVCQVCEYLQGVGIFTVNLHSGASIDHQIHSLKGSEPEFLVSTPERLLELLSLKAIDLSELSLMVIDGLEPPFRGTYLDAVKSIRHFISGNPQIIVLCDYMNYSSIHAYAKAVGGSVCKQLFNTSDKSEV